MPLTWRSFGGIQPAIEPLKLPPTAAQRCENVDFRSGSLRSGATFHDLRQVDDILTKSITPKLVGGVRLDKEWPFPTDFIIYGSRVYISCGGALDVNQRRPRILDNEGDEAYLGFPRLDDAYKEFRGDDKTISIFSPGEGGVEDGGLEWRFGITLVDAEGYESSLITAADGTDGFQRTAQGSVSVSFKLPNDFLYPAAGDAKKRVSEWRLYATRGRGIWWLMSDGTRRELDAGQNAAADNAQEAITANNVRLSLFGISSISITGERDEPPNSDDVGYLQGIGLLENGFGVGFVNIQRGDDVEGQLVFSLQNQLAKWPISWRYSVDFRISQIVVFQNSVLVFGLNRRPLEVRVNNPQAVSINEILGNYTYIGGAARVQEDVWYMSRAGVASIRGSGLISGVRLSERSVDEFGVRYALSVGDHYYLFGRESVWHIDRRPATPNGYEIGEIPDTNSSAGYALDDDVFVIRQRDSEKTLAQLREFGDFYRWRSRRVRLPRPRGFRAIRIDYDLDERQRCRLSTGAHEWFSRGEGRNLYSVRRGFFYFKRPRSEWGKWYISAYTSKCQFRLSDFACRVFAYSNNQEEYEIPFHEDPKSVPSGNSLTLQMLESGAQSNRKFPTMSMPICLRVQNWEIQVEGNVVVHQISLLEDPAMADIIPFQEQQQ